jgi:DNA-binding XRE family transcriptional regulator
VPRHAIFQSDNLRYADPDATGRNGGMAKTAAERRVARPRDPGRGKEGFGARVRRLRKEAGLTLQALSAQSGLAASTLSKVENGKLSPTYDNLLKLANGLGVDQMRLFADGEPSGRTAQPTAGPAGRLTVTRVADRLNHPPGVHYQYDVLASGLLQRVMDPAVITILAREMAGPDQLIRHEGDEFALVLEGAVVFHSEFYAPIPLETGDSLYYDARMGHGFVSTSAAPARILNIVGFGSREMGPPA